jgi:hypothetical protein
LPQSGAVPAMPEPRSGTRKLSLGIMSTYQSVMR